MRLARSLRSRWQHFRRRSRRDKSQLNRRYQPRIEAMELRQLLAAVSWDGGGGNLLWSNPLNWSSDQLPGAADDVTISLPETDPTVNIDKTFTVKSLNSSEAIHISSGMFTLSGSSSLSKGLTIASGASLVAKGAGTIVEAIGPTVADGASLFAYSGATLSLPFLTRYKAGTTNGDRYFQARYGTSVIDLPNLETLETNAGGFTTYIQAYENSGNRVNLPKLASLSGNSVALYAEGNGSLIDLPLLASWNGQFPGGRYSSLTAGTGGTVRFNTALSTSGVEISVDATSRLIGTELQLGTNSILSGQGEIVGNVTNSAGTVNVGKVPSGLRIKGNYTQLPAGTLTVAIDGAAASGNYSQLLVTGEATIAGKLAITRSGGFVPALTDQYSVVSGDSVIGSFSSVTGGTIAGGDLTPYFFSKVVALSRQFAFLGDLAPSNVQGPSAVNPGATETVDWTVSNTGQTAITGSRTTKVFLSSDNGVGGDLLVGTFSYSDTIDIGQSISRSETVTIPTTGTQSSGILRFVVVEDADGAVAEFDETNNAAISAATTTVPVLLSLTPAANIVNENASPATLGITVSRTGNLSLPLEITLACDCQALTVPASVIILAGQATAAFTVGIVHDGLVTPDQVAQITASAVGLTSVSATVTVRNTDTPRLSVSLDKEDVTEGGSVVATITRNSQLDTALSVVLTESNTHSALPQFVIPPVAFSAGQSSVLVTLETTQDAIIEKSKLVTLTAAATNVPNATATVTVIDDDLPNLTLSVSPETFSESAGATAAVGRVAREVVTNQPLTVRLSSSSSSKVTVPATVVIPANQDSVNFSVAAVDNLIPDGAFSVTVSANGTYPECGCVISTGGSSFEVRVLDNEQPTLQLSLSKTLVYEDAGTNASTGTVTRMGTDNSAELVVTLSSSLSTAATVPATVTIPAGQQSVTFPIAAVEDNVTSGNKQVTITASSGGLVNGSATLTVTDVDLPDLVVTSIFASTNATPPEPVSNVVTGSGFFATYTVKNQGRTTATGTWSDRIYISPDNAAGNDVLVGTFSITATLAPGQSYTRTVPVQAQNNVGNMWLVGTTDLALQVLENDESNNTSVATAPVSFSAEYSATVGTTVDVALAGTAIQMTGNASLVGASTPAAFKAVNIHVQVRGTERIISAMTNAAGNFSATFTPLPGEAGDYTIFATHPGVKTGSVQDSFSLIGLSSTPPAPTVSVVEGSQANGQVILRNLSQRGLSNLQAVVVSKPANVGVSWQIGNGSANFALAGDATTTLTFTVTANAPQPATGTILLRVTTGEGVTLDVPVSVQLIALAPHLVTDPAGLNAGMLRGAQTLVEFTVTNDGGRETGPLTLSLPNVPWMSAVTSPAMASIPAGGSTKVVLQLMPPADLGLGDYSGQIGINGTGVSKAIPFSFRALSTATGSVSITVEDEYTYFAEGNPRLAGASLKIIDAVDGSVAAIGVSDGNGQFVVSSLREGYYNIVASAVDHNPFTATIVVIAGQTNAVRAFLPQQIVTYNWTVTPTTVDDQTKISLNAIFEANVPVPTVTIEPRTIDFASLDFSRGSAQIDFVLYNHGLVAANNVRLAPPLPEGFQATPLINGAFTLQAQSGVVIPVTYWLRDYTIDVHSTVTIERSADVLVQQAIEERLSELMPPVTTTLGEPWVSHLTDGVCLEPRPVDPFYGTPGDGASFITDCPDCPPAAHCVTEELFEQLQSDEAFATNTGLDVIYTIWGETASSIYKEYLGGNSSHVPVFRSYDSGPIIDGTFALNPIEQTLYTRGFKNSLTSIDVTERLLELATFNLVQQIKFGQRKFCDLPEHLEISALLLPSQISDLEGKLKYIYGDMGGLLAGGIGGSARFGHTGDPTDPGSDKRELLGKLRVNKVTDCSGARFYLSVDDEFKIRVTDFVDFCPGDLGKWPASYLTSSLRNLETHDWAYPVPYEAVFTPQYLLRSDPISSEVQDVTEYACAEGCLPCCITFGSATWEYECGDITITRTAYSAINGGCEECATPSMPSAPGQSWISGGGTQGGIIAAPHFTITTSGPCTLPSAAVSTRHSDGSRGAASLTDDGICAQVRLEIDQSAIQSRDAFAASLSLINSRSTPLNDVHIEITLLDASGNIVNHLFSIASPHLRNLSAIDGTGGLAGNSTGTVDWTVIPSLEASAATPQKYTVGGTLSYVDNGVLVTINLSPVTITVLPQPELFLDYFLQRDVFSDDPHTPEIEPSLPFELNVMVKNQGFGDARNLRIDSAQPQIVDNEKGLLINFQIIATEILGEGGNLAPSLTANFGTILAGETKIGRWYMTSSLQGLFTEYDATFQHVSELGDNRLSLIKDVRIHELIHSVQDTRSGADARPDFLTNAVADAADLPDTLYFSSGGTAPVGLFSSPVFDGVVSDSNLQVQLTATGAAGWNYLRVKAPGDGRFRLTKVLRSDGVELPIANFWQTDRTFIGNGQRPIVEDIIHLLDFDSSGSYTLKFTNGDVDGPEVVSFAGVLPDPTTQAIDVVDIRFNEELNQASFGSDSLLIKKNSATVATPSLSIDPIGNNTYRISGLAAYTSDDANYELYVDLSSLTDQAGNPGVGLRSYRWTKDATAPSSQIQPLPVSHENPTFTLNVVGSDPEFSPGVAGTGISRYDIFVAEDAGPFSYYRSLPGGTTSTTFTGQPGSQYRFYSVARDATGNVEAAPEQPDAVTNILNPQPASIGNRVWLDTNGNGVQDDGEVGKSGVMVRLFMAGQGKPLAEALTNDQGVYTFNDLNSANSYFLEFVAPAGLGFALANAGGSDTTDSNADVVTGRTTVFSVLAGANDQWDAGLIELSTLGGIAWQDSNGNRQLDAGERRLAGQIVYLDVNQNGSKDNDEPFATTNQQGAYTFTNLRPGSYLVRYVLPEGWEQTQPGSAGASSNSATQFSFTGSEVALTAPGFEVFPGLSANDQSVGQSSGAAQDTGRVDVNGDGRVSAMDALQIINRLNSGSAELSLQSASLFDPLDVNLDGRISAMDALLVINALNSGDAKEFSGNALASPSHPANAAQAGRLIGLDRLRADSQYSQIDGRGLAVVVIDTGVDLNHPFFGSDNGGDGVADRIVYQYDFADRDADAGDVTGHGSHVTSIIASGNVNYPGVAPGVDIISLKVFSDSSSGTFADLERALQWVIASVNTYNIAAVNMSLGDGQNWSSSVGSYGVTDELAALDALGVITVAAAGNSFASFGSRQGLAYPAADPNVISVGAVWDADRGRQSFGSFGTDYTTAADRIAGFSQRDASYLDLLAPGALITGANATGGIVTMRGTSMAAPYVTGAAVLAQQVALAEHGRRLSNAEMRDLLRVSGVIVRDGDDENSSVTATGAAYSRLDVVNLLSAVKNLNVDSDQPNTPTDDDPGQTGVIDTLNGSYAYQLTLEQGEVRTDIDFGSRPIGATPPRVEPVLIGGGAPQRSTIRNLDLSFDKEVEIDAGAFELQSGGQTVPIRFVTELVDGKTKVKIVFEPSPFVGPGGSLIDGNYRLVTKHTHIRDQQGTPLDGSDSGQPGTSQVDDFFRLYGDANGDRMVRMLDFVEFRKAYNSRAGDANYDAAFDYEGDGDVDLIDMVFMRRNIGKHIAP